jgi:type I restriction enzyme S subunit
MKDSGVEWLGQVPAHWEVARQAQLFREIAEPGNDDLPVLSVSIHTGVSDGEVDPEDADRKITRSEDRSKYKSVQPGDLVYNMMRAWQGGFGTVTTLGAVSPAYVVARPLGDLETQFVELLLRTPQAVEEMRARSRGITDFRLRLYWEQFREIVIAIPPKEERIAILEFVLEEARKMEALSTQAEAAITLLQERRAALISAAVTGKIDVRGLVKTAEAA